MDDSPKYWCVVPAAGVGKRMGAALPKQYLTLAGKTVIEHTVERLICLSKIINVVVVVVAEDQYWEQLEISNHGKVRTVAGGQERFQSVLNGLEWLRQAAADDDWVLVHDAARPCVRPSDIEKLIEQLNDSSVGGLLASPIQNTVKQCDAQRQVLKTVDRGRYWHAYTPQMFRFGLIYRALVQADNKENKVTDEASAVEALGFHPLLVEGARDNIKITHSEDLVLAEAFLKKQMES